MITEQHNRVFIFHIGKECDYRTGGAMETILADSFGEELKVIGVNCESMTFIDSTGVGGLTRVRQYSKKNNIQFILYGLNEIMEQLFEFNKWETIFQLMSKTDFGKTYLGE